MDSGLDGADVTSPQARDAQDRAARASWAALPAGELAFARSEPSRSLGDAQARGRARLRGLAWGLGLTLLGLACGVWIAVLARMRAAGAGRAPVRRTALLLIGLTVIVLLPATVLFVLVGSVVLGELAAKLLLALLLVAWLAALLFLGFHFWRRRDDPGQIVVLLIAAYGLLGALLGFVAERGGDPGPVWVWMLLLAFVATWMALLVLAAGLWAEGRRALSGVVVVLVLLTVALVVLAGMVWSPSSLLARTAADPRVYAGPVGWLSGCAPLIEEPLPEPTQERQEAVRTVVVEKEVEKVVKETVVVEKEVEVTRVVEVEKEVTKVVSGTPAFRATPTEAAEALLPTATPLSTGTPPPVGTPPAGTPMAIRPSEPSLPLMPGEALPPASPTPLPTPTPPLPLLGQVAAETIYWVPEAITDPQGRLVVEFPFPDVPTAWRMTVLASTLNGELGEATTTLPVR